MGLFGKKKEKEESSDFKFDSIPNDFPKYEASNYMDDSFKIKEAVSEPFKPIMPMQSNPMSSIQGTEFNGRIKQGRTLFVKIEKYKEVMKTLDEIRNKLEDSEKILVKLNEIKNEEDKELDSWHSDLQDLKEKLLDIDKKLFEE